MPAQRRTQESGWVDGFHSKWRSQTKRKVIQPPNSRRSSRVPAAIFVGRPSSDDSCEVFSAIQSLEIIVDVSWVHNRLASLESAENNARHNVLFRFLKRRIE